MNNDRKMAQEIMDYVYWSAESEELYIKLMLKGETSEVKQAYWQGRQHFAAEIKRDLSLMAEEYGLTYPPPSRNLRLVVDNTKPAPK